MKFFNHIIVMSCIRRIRFSAARLLASFSYLDVRSIFKSRGKLRPPFRLIPWVNWADDISTVKASDLFDKEWYVSCVKDEVISIDDAAIHYVKFGAQKGISPSLNFDGNAYLEANPDVKRVGYNPLIHYVRYGKHENRSVTPTLTHFLEHITRAVLVDHLNIHRDRLRVLFICHSLVSSEGAPRSLFELIIHLKNTFGIIPTVFSAVRRDMSECYDKLGISLITAHSSPNYFSWNTVADSFRDVLKNDKPDIVIANTSQSLWLATIAKRSNIPTVSIIRESCDEFINFKFGPHAFMQATKSGLLSSDEIVFVSKACQSKWLKNHDIKSSSVIHNGTPIGSSFAGHINSSHIQSRIHRLNNETSKELITFLCVGTINPRKGQVDVVRAFSLLSADSISKSRVVFVGASSENYVTILMDYVRSLNAELSSRIEIHPESKAIDEWYSSADVLISASYSEAYPRVITEAMAHALPIISSSVEGVSEQLDDGISGIIFKAGDIEDLARHMQRLVSDDTLRTQLAIGAYKRFEQLPTIKDSGSKYFETITKVLAADDSAND